MNGFVKMPVMFATLGEMLKANLPHARRQIAALQYCAGGGDSESWRGARTLAAAASTSGCSLPSAGSSISST